MKHFTTSCTSYWN